MGPRLVVGAGPNDSFPRWGFLDKFTVNEYLPRALVLTFAATLVGVALVTAWQRLPDHPQLRIVEHGMPHFTDVINPTPIPSIQPNRIQVRQKAKKTLQRTGIIVPAPTPVTDAEWTGTGSVADPDATTSVEGDPEDVLIMEGSGGSAPWPSPDELIVVEHEPVLITMPTPDYPEIARDAGIEGTVVVRALVDATGAVRDTRILKSVLGLDEAAAAAAATAVFRPAMQQDRPVAVWILIPIEFRLRD